VYIRYRGLLKYFQPSLTGSLIHYISSLPKKLEKNIKFADAVMGHWGLEKNLAVVFTYDEKGFKRIEGLDVRKPR